MKILRRRRSAAPSAGHPIPGYPVPLYINGRYAGHVVDFALVDKPLEGGLSIRATVLDNDDLAPRRHEYGGST